VYREGILVVSEIVVAIKGNHKETHSPGSYGKQVMSLDLKMHIEVIEHVIVRLNVGIVLKLLNVFLLFEA